jgi:hypothetical protein
MPKHILRKRIIPLKISDSSTLPLNLTNHKWAKFRKTTAGVKLHVRLVFIPLLRGSKTPTSKLKKVETFRRGINCP